MQKRFLVSVAFVFAAFLAFSQGTLQFNQVLIVSNTPSTVPTGKVWKVMAVYGKQANQCTLDPFNIWGSGYYWSYKSRGFQVNGNTVWQQISEAIFIIKSNSSCTSADYTSRSWTDAQAMAFKNEVGHQTADDLAAMLPFWVPEGTSVNSMSSQQYLSILEFNIIP